MAYDSPQYQAYQVIGPIFCTFAAQATTQAHQTHSPASGTDRIVFMKKVKLLDYIVVQKTATDASASPTGDHVNKLYVATVAGAITHGSSAALGTVADVAAEGVFAITTLASNTPLYPTWVVTQDGTAATLAAWSADIYIRYKEAFVS